MFPKPHREQGERFDGWLLAKVKIRHEHGQEEMVRILKGTHFFPPVQKLCCICALAALEHQPRDLQGGLGTGLIESNIGAQRVSLEAMNSQIHTHVQTLECAHTRAQCTK